jgi:hypothetical protein
MTRVECLKHIGQRLLQGAMTDSSQAVVDLDELVVYAG